MQITAHAHGYRRSVSRTLALAATLLPVLATAQYSQHNLVSDGFVSADHIDSQLVNPWGMSFSATSPFWIADNGSTSATLYNGSGVKQALSVTTPAGPTGTVFNGTSDFAVSNGTTSAAATFLFADLGGLISGWNPTVNSTQAVLGADMSASGAHYTGLAIQTGGAGSRLYAADFARGSVDIFNSTFGYVGSFTDITVDQGFAPFNVQSIGSSLYVEFAKVGANGREAVGDGLGFVDEFDRNGNLIRRLASHGVLNAPWGITKAPSNFGAFSNDILVGNFGDGRINAFNPTNGAYAGTIADAGGIPITNEDLWSIQFGNGGNGGNTNSLYFTAGVGNEAHGLFGRLDAVPEPTSMAALAVGVIAVLKRKRRK